jgi:DNA-binding beta-propeller fold protein YncE
MRHPSLLLAALMIVSAAPLPAAAQIVLSANDAKAVLVDGVQTILASPAADTLSIIDLSGTTPRVIAEIAVPTTVIGPPSSVAIAPDESIALVTAAQRVDPANPTATIAHNAVSVVDLRAAPPRVVATVPAGAGASGVSINPAGTLALVANRAAGTISVLTITGSTVTPAGTVDLGAPDSGPSHVAFAPNGRTALVTRNNDSLVSVLEIDGTAVTYTRRDLVAGFKPYQIEVAPAGDVAITGTIGAGATGSADVLGVIDLRADPARGIDQITVGQTAEGIDISPDGRFVAVTVMNGSNQPAASPFFNDHGLLRIFALRGTRLTPVTQIRIGRWCQGVAWTPDSDRVMAGCMVDRQIHVFGFDGQRLTPATTIPVPGGSAALATGGL